MQDKFITDHELLRLIRESPQEGLKIIITRYGGLVKTICKNILLETNTEDIEEAVDDSFLNLWLAVNNHVVITVSIKSYLAGIARHCAINKLNNRIRNDCMALPDDYDLGVDLDMSSEIVRKINTEILRDVIQKMPSIEQEIFVRRYYFYEKINDIAKSMSLSPKKIENILYRYKSKLKNQLIERGVIL